MTNIFDSFFEEATFVKSKTNRVFSEDDVYTFLEKNDVLETACTYKDFI